MEIIEGKWMAHNVHKGTFEPDCKARHILPLADKRLMRFTGTEYKRSNLTGRHEL